MPRSTGSAPSALIRVVDDDALVREMLAASLTRAGYRVVLASDGAAAIDRLSRETPDLVLTDLFMPNRDGIELLRSGRLSRAGAPVIAMSGGYAGLDMLGASEALGAAASIAKPFMPRELLALVRRVLGEVGADAGTRRTSGPDCPAGQQTGPGGAVASACR
jgi:DNA-binding response OmpR family regulator